MQGLLSNEEGVQKMTAQLLEMKAIDKSFSEVKVLQQAQFSLESGEVHALMGENGAGKSTLMKKLNGIYAKDGGTVTVKGAEQALSTRRPRSSFRNHHDSSGAEPDSAFDRDGEHLPWPGIYVRTNEAD